MTVAPPYLRLHLVPALCVTALLCAALACPAAAKSHAAKAPPGQSKKAGNGGNAGKGAEKHAAKAPSDQATKPANPKPAKPKPAKPKPAKPKPQKTKPKTPGNPHTAPVAPVVVEPPPSSVSNAPATRSRRAAASVRAAARRRAAAARRAAAVRRRAAAGDGARGTYAGEPALGGGAAEADAAGGAGRGDGGPAGGSVRGTEERAGANDGRPPFEPVISREDLPQPLRLAQDVVEVVPTPLRVLLAGLVAVAILLAVASGLTLLRNRRLARERRELLGEVGLLQAALLPDLPDKLVSCRASVAYRPADGPGAGGDFYDVLHLAGGQTAVLIGDVSGHGRAALARTALARYSLRAYVEAGLEPHEALQVTGSVLAGKLEGDFVTALVAIHDSAAGTLTYATAGHPPPIVVSSARFDPILVGTAPPLGVGATTGQRQTTLPFPPGAVACFYTDGLSEARIGDGQFGAERLERVVREFGPDVTAKRVIDRVASSAHTIADDAAACVIVAEEGARISRSRVERLELSRAELRGALLREFLDACGVSAHGVRHAEREARTAAREMGGAVVNVRMAEPPQVDVRPPELPLADGQLRAAQR